MDRSRLQARHEGEPYRRVEVITGRRGRQNWPAREKARIVAESLAPDANISEVARRNGVSRGLLTVWRRLARETLVGFDGPAVFTPIRVTNNDEHRERAAVAAERQATPAARSAIEVTIADAVIRVPPGADAGALEALIAALRRSR